MTDVGKHMQECRRSRGPLAEASRCGFTLLEVLVAMTILIVIILIMSTVFNQSATVWDRGLRKAEMSMEGRSALNLMTREIGQAVADNTLEAKLKSGSDIEFHTWGMSSDSNRQIRLVRYWKSGRKLRRSSGEFAFLGGYPDRSGGAPGVDLIENVTAFRIKVFPDSTYTTNLPQWVDITLELERGSEVSVANAWSSGPDGINDNGEDDDVTTESQD